MSGNYNARFWDDLSFPAQKISLVGLTQPPDVEVDTGLLLFDGVDQPETIAVLAQMKHTWDEGTELRPHVHWSKTTSAAGAVVWFYRYRWWNVGAPWSDWSAPVALTEAVPTGDVSEVSGVASDVPINEPTAKISSMFLIQLGRLPEDVGDTYAADARLEEFDIHYMKDQAGSRSEFLKD